jgi:hypothetical protein
MAATTVIKALTNYFNESTSKRPNTQWLAELKALSTEEKRALAEGVAALTGDTLPAL